MNQPIRMTRTVLMVVAVVFCFTGVAAAQGAQKIDSCTLLTKAQIQAAVGQNVGDGKLNAKANPAVGAPCEYVIGDYGMIQLNTFKGPWYLIITMLVPGATEAAQKTAAEKLMRDALTKI